VGIVRGEQVELVAGLGDEPADVLERERCERELVDDLLGRTTRERPHVGIVPREIVDGVVDASEHARHPRGAELDGPATKGRMTFEHAVEHQHRQELLGIDVQNREVLEAQGLATTQEAHGLTAPRVHVLVADLDALRPDMEQERDPSIGKRRPDGIEIDVPR